MRSMNYPLGTAIIGFASAGRLDGAIIEQHGTYQRMLVPLDGRGFARRLDHLMSVYDPAITAVQLNLLGSHDAPRLLTLMRRDLAAARGSRCSSSSSCRARRASTTATSWRWRAATTRTAGGRSPPIRAPAIARCGRSWRR